MKKILFVALAMVIAGCGTNTRVQPWPEERICVRTEDNVRVGDNDCMVAAGDRKWLRADPAELDQDDYTPIGQVANDDYLEKKTESAPKTTKPKPTTATSQPRPTK